MPTPFSQVTHVLMAGLDLLFLGLVVLAVAAGTQSGSSPWLMALLGAAFIAAYVLGRASLKTHHAPLDASRGRWWPEAAWFASLVVAWLALLWFSPPALWVAFPLMIVGMHTLGPRWGSVAVGAVACFAIAHSFRTGFHGWSSLGGVLGPLVGGGVAIAVVIGLETLARENQRRQVLLDELTQARTYLAEAERDRAVLGERERLAREIHDTLAQGFSAIDLLLRAAGPQLGPGPASELVTQAGQTARDNLAEARRFVRALAPADLEDAQADTLPAALRRCCERSSAQHPGLATELLIEGEAERLSVPTEAALVRITQSALANVWQHADASSATVRLRYLTDEVRLSITDNGIGFDPATASLGRSFGLRGMRSRVRELDGQLDIASAPGEGSTITVRIPREGTRP